MPKKIRELLEQLQRNGFIDRGGKGSHRNLVHPLGVKITLSGKSGDDAKPYQEKDVKLAISKVMQ